MDLFKNNVVAGIGLTFAAAILAPIILPAAGRVGRPLAKSMVKSGMLLYEKGREALAVAGESVEDLMAEIRAENSHYADGNGAAQAAADGPAAPSAPMASAGNGQHLHPNGAAVQGSPGHDAGQQ